MNNFSSISYCSEPCNFQGQKDANSMYEELRFLSHLGALDHDLYVDILSPPFQDDIGIFSSLKSPNSQHRQPHQDILYPFPSASLQILSHYRSKIATTNGNKIHRPKTLQPSPPSTLSTNQIIELSAGNFIQTNSATANDLSAISNPYANTFLCLPNDHAKDVLLVQDLLSCAGKVHDQQYDSARKLLEECDKRSFEQKNTVQRLVYYFTRALCDKIELETRKLAGKLVVPNWPLHPTAVSSALATFKQNSPPNQVIQFASIQSVADNVSDCRKVHIIDLGIKFGVPQMIIMQALVARSGQCPLQRLKITALATDSDHMVANAAVRLRKLAESLNLDFSFRVIGLDETLDPQGSSLELDPEEATVVHASYALDSMIAQPKQLEALMRFIRKINPRVMIVSEIEANVNSPVFVDRFVEALLFYGASFDCLRDCVENDAAGRAFVEANLLGPVIRNTVAYDGEERVFRTVGVNVWREFFGRFGMVEMELGRLVLDHANLMLNRSESRDSCTLSMNGKCLIASWKGTPLCSLSAWKFQKTLFIPR